MFSLKGINLPGHVLSRFSRPHVDPLARDASEETQDFALSLCGVDDQVPTVVVRLWLLNGRREFLRQVFVEKLPIDTPVAKDMVVTKGE